MELVKASDLARLAGGQARELARRVSWFAERLARRRSMTLRAPWYGVPWSPVGLVWWRMARRELDTPAVPWVSAAPGKTSPGDIRPAPLTSRGPRDPAPSVGPAARPPAPAADAPRVPAPLHQARGGAGGRGPRAPHAAASSGPGVAAPGDAGRTSPRAAPAEVSDQGPGGQSRGAATPGLRAPHQESPAGLEAAQGSTFDVPNRLVYGPFRWLTEARRHARIHVGVDADRRARAAGARAVTVGRDIFFRAGAFEPQTVPGLALISHELTHVWQHARRGGPLRAATEARLVGELEREASTVERSVLRTLGMDTVRRGAALAAPAANVTPVAFHYTVARAETASRAAGRAARPAAAAAPGGGLLPLRAAEDHAVPVTAAEGTTADPVEVAAHVFRMLERRLQIDRERAGAGRG